MPTPSTTSLMPYARVLVGVVGLRSDICRALVQLVEAAYGFDVADRFLAQLVDAVDAKRPTRVEPEGLDVLRYCAIRLRWANRWSDATEHTLFEMVATVHGTQVAREFVRSVGPSTTGPIRLPMARPRSPLRPVRSTASPARAPRTSSRPIPREEITGAPRRPSSSSTGPGSGA